MRLIFFLFCLVLLPACSVNTKLIVDKGQVQLLETPAQVPFITKNRLIFIPVKIDNQEYYFMLDTGAGISAIDTKLARRLEMKKMKNLRVSDAANQTDRISQSSLTAIEIGGYQFQNTAVIIYDFSNFPITIPNFGGIIGQPIISKINWKIDFKKGQLELSEASFSVGQQEKIPFIYHRNQLPYLTLILEGEPFIALLDTGSANQVEFPDDNNTSKYLLKNYPVYSDTLENYTLNQRTEVVIREVKVPHIILGKTTSIEEVYVSIKNLDELRVGANLFNDKILILDTDNQWIAVE